MPDLLWCLSFLTRYFVTVQGELPMNAAMNAAGSPGELDELSVYINVYWQYT